MSETQSTTAQPMTKLGKFWTDAVAYVALSVGSGLSIAGNVADTFRMRGAAVDTLDIVMAVAWPALVVLMVEIFVSRRWEGLPWPMQIIRWTGTLAIGGMAMRVSWVHLNDLMASRGQTADVATLGPLAIDALAIMATALILAGRRTVAKVVATPSLVTTWTPPPVDSLDVATARRQLELDKHMAMLERERMAMDSAPTRPAKSRTLDDLDKEMATDGAVDIEAWMAGAERAYAEAGRQMASEVVEYVATASAPAVKDSAKINGEEAYILAAHGVASSDLTLGQISELLGGHYGVSARTVRRQSWWPAVSGRPISGAPTA